MTSWIDYKCEGSQTYEYLLFANSPTQISLPIITDMVRTNFYGYFLISSDADSMDVDINSNVEVYKFDIDVASDKVSINNDLTTLKNYSAYDVAVIGNRSFKSGGFSSKMISSINGIYDFEGRLRWQNDLDNLKNFLGDKKYKYLKTRGNGELIKVITEGSSSTLDIKYNDSVTVGKEFGNSNQLCDVSIFWTEIGSVD